MSGGRSIARQLSAFSSERRPRAVSQDACQAATAFAQSATGSATPAAYGLGSPELRRPRHAILAEMTCETCGSRTSMRRDTTENRHDCSGSYGAGTRVEVHRSRYELERVLRSYGAGEVLFVE